MQVMRLRRVFWGAITIIAVGVAIVLVGIYGTINQRSWDQTVQMVGVFIMWAGTALFFWARHKRRSLGAPREHQ